MKPDCALSEFIDACKGEYMRHFRVMNAFQHILATKSPEERAKLLEETHLFANMHSEAASSGQSAVPSNLDTENHFTCFVQAPSSEPDEARGAKGMRLVELDGRRAGPIDRGASENLLMVRPRMLWVTYHSLIDCLSGRCKVCQGEFHRSVGEYQHQYDCSRC
jgi:hypothetical protein